MKPAFTAGLKPLVTVGLKPAVTAGLKPAVAEVMKPSVTPVFNQSDSGWVIGSCGVPFPIVLHHGHVARAQML